MRRMRFGVFVSVLLGMAFITADATAQENGDCWACEFEGTDCFWDPYAGQWFCEDASTWCEEGVDGWEDCAHNMSQTWCDTEGYDECEDPDLAFLPGIIGDGGVDLLTAVGRCGSGIKGLVRLYGTEPADGTFPAAVPAGMRVKPGPSASGT